MDLNIKDISFSYGKKEILSGINFNADKGDVISIVGPNGSGKTTFLKTLNKILKVKSGEVNFENENLITMNYENISKKIAYVPQMIKESFDSKVLDVIILGRIPHVKWKLSEEDLKIVIEVMKELNIENLAEENFNSLSGGQKQKVLIAKALVQETDIYLLDEPISFLDIRNQIDVMKTIEKIAKEKGKIIIMVIHDLNMARKYSTKVVLMNSGNVVDFGNSKEILNEKNIAKVYKIKTEIINDYIIVLE